MRFWRAGLLAATALAAACAQVSEQPSSTASEALPTGLSGLSGHYSNFGQVAENSGLEVNPPGVVDLEISPLGESSHSAWRVVHRDRSSGDIQDRLFLFKGSGDELQLRVSILSKSEASSDPQQALKAAAGRFDEDCAILMSPTDNGLVGHTDHHRCRFNHPLLGDVGLFRQVGVSDMALSIDEFFLDNKNEPAGEIVSQTFDLHRQYRANVRLRLGEGDVADLEWWDSAATLLADDGKLAPLADEAGSDQGFSLQLAWLPWQPNQPDFLRLAVINPATGVVNAYKWIQPGTRETRFASDWLEIELAVLPKNGAGQPPE